MNEIRIKTQKIRELKDKISKDLNIKVNEDKLRPFLNKKSQDIDHSEIY